MAKEKASEAWLNYKKHFDCRVKNIKEYNTGDWVFVDNLPVVR